MEPPSLNGLVGQEILLLAEVFDSSQLQPAVLLAVEEHGIWIENSQWTKNFILDEKKAAVAKSAALFLPHSQVRLIVIPISNASVSESG
jgi:hypothetical protein